MPVLAGLLALLLVGSPTCRIRRGDDGRIRRDPRQIALFKATVACPRTGKVGGRCSGYVVDHVCPLSCCGKDDPSNMQWQTNTEAKAKDAWEQDCSSWPGGSRAPEATAAKNPSKPAL